MKHLLAALLVLLAATVARAEAQETVTLTCVVTDGSVPAAPDAGVPPVVDSGVPPIVDAGPPPIGGARPPTSRGEGFYVVGSHLFDANGHEHRMRGTNKTHQDNWGPGLGHTASNTTRWLVYFADDPERTIADMQSPNIGGTTEFGRAVQVPGFWDGTCKSDPGTFETMVSRWVRDARKYQDFERYMILNIANEWGDDHRAWRDAYVSAIPRIRNAGWHGAIMVDAPGCGQDAQAIVEYGADVLHADPERNVLFDWHIYGMVCDSQGGVPPQWNGQLDLVPTMDRLRDTGLTVVVGEFGPGRGIGPSPTNVTPERIIDVSEKHGIGWLSWSWEDNDQANAKCSNTSFCHVFDTSSVSIEPDNLTDFGKVMVAEWTAYAQPASIFGPTQQAFSTTHYLLLLIAVLLIALLVWQVVQHYRARRRQRAATDRVVDHDE